MSTVIQLDPETLRPLVQAVVGEALRQLEADRARIPGDKLAYTEEEAARLLSLKHTQLRDERHRGRIKASLGPGKTIRYTLAQLMEYLASRPYVPSEKAMRRMSVIDGPWNEKPSPNGKPRAKRRSASD
jgi:hypothetical protein